MIWIKDLTRGQISVGMGEQDGQCHAGLVPNFSGGPKPKLGDAEREELKRILGDKDAWTLREVRVLIKERFGVEYSEMQIWRMLTSWNMRHAKPYVLDKRRPDEAEIILKKIRD